MPKFKTIVILVVLPFIFGYVSEDCYHGQADASSARAVLESKVAEAYELARSSMLQENQVEMDVLWALYHFSRGDQELKRFIAESKKTVYNPHFAPGVFPDLPRIKLPEHPDCKIRKFMFYVKAAFGEPQDRALLWIRDFIGAEEEGYILTHQFLSLIWAEQAGLPLSEGMLSRRQELWRKVYEEQCSMGNVDSIDLYMERMAIVLTYGCPDDVDRVLVDAWVKTMLDLQLDDGSWPLSKTRISYDGASTVISFPRSHTTALAMMALDSYLKAYEYEAR